MPATHNQNGLQDGEASPDTIPKSLQHTRNELKQYGVALTLEAVKEHLNTIDPQQWKRLVSSVGYLSNGGLKKDVNQTTLEEKKNWVAQYVLVPHHVAAKGYNKSSVTDTKAQVEEDAWKTQKQIGHILKDADAAEISCASDDLLKRANEFPSLAAKGIMPYHFIEKKNVSGNIIADEAGVISEAQLTGGEAQMMAFLNDFVFLVFVAFLAMPLCFLLKREKKAPS